MTPVNHNLTSLRSFNHRKSGKILESNQSKQSTMSTKTVLHDFEQTCSNTV